MWKRRETRWQPSPATLRRTLLLLTILATALRAPVLDLSGFWTDEAITSLRASYPIGQILRNDVIIQDFLTKDSHPPFYYLIIHLTSRLLGQTDFAYRLPSLLAGVLLVPLLGQLGHRLMSPAAGLLAALLVASSPLHVWYAGDARMYTLYTLLAVASSYALWQAVQQRNLRWLTIYLPLAAVTIYTNYTAVFLLAVHALFWTWLLWQLGQRRLIIATAVLATLITLPLIPFTIPRLFTGTEANFFFVSPLTMLGDLGRFFSLGLSVDYDQPLIILFWLIITLFALMGLFTLRKQPVKLLFLLGNTTAVLFGLMLGSLLFKPMYQGVRHIMVGSPFFLLLVALGLQFTINYSQLIIHNFFGGGVEGETGGRNLNTQQENQPRLSRPAVLSFIIVCLSFLISLSGPTLSLRNLYRGDYLKDDFRSMIAYIERHAGGNDVVIYNNAVHLPLHHHYQQRADIVVTASPVFATLATNATPQLEQLATTYDRIWFITDPPADKRDENGRIQQWLGDNLLPLDNILFNGRTVEVRTLVYSTAPAMLNELPENGRSLTTNTADSLPNLSGVQLSASQPLALPTLWVDLFWQGETPLPTGTNLRFSLRDQQGIEALVEWVDVRRETAAFWSSTQHNRRSHPIPLPAGLPAGPYELFVQPYRTGANTPLGDVTPLGSLTTAPTIAWPLQPQPALNDGYPLRFDNGVTLLGIDYANGEVRAGHTLPVTTFWQDEAVGRNVAYRLEVLDSQGNQIRQQTDPITVPWLTEWPLGTTLRDATGLYFSPETPPGTYYLRWQLLQDDQIVNGRPTWRPWSSPAVLQHTIEVVPWPLITEPPSGGQRIDAAFGNVATLFSYDLQETADFLTLTLSWQVQTPPTDNLKIFVHLVTPDGTVASQQDVFPVNGLRPSRGWRNGEFITDEIVLPLPAAPQTYQLNVGLYHPENGVRLPIIYEGVAQPNDQMTLTEVVRE